MSDAGKEREGQACPERRRRACPEPRRRVTAPLEIVIRRDGQVVLRTITQEMLELALALAPGDPKLRARASKLPAQTGEGQE